MLLGISMLLELIGYCGLMGEGELGGRYRLQLLCWSGVRRRLVWVLLWPMEVMGEGRIVRIFQLRLGQDQGEVGLSLCL